MAEDFKLLQLDRLDKKGKSFNTDSLKKHALEPTLETKPIDKAIYLITKGDEIQKISVIESLPQLASLDLNSVLTKVLPKIQQELTKSSSEFHITCSRIFQSMIEKNVKADGNVIAIILQGIESKDPVVANAWLETLLAIIHVLPVRTVQADILSLAVLKGQCAQPTTSRVSSCKILGRIVLHPQMKALEIKKDVLPTIYSLCQDINYTVRATICEQLPAVAKGLGANLVKNVLLSSLVELSSDDNANVRAVAVAAVIQILPFVDKETKSNAMVNLVMNMCSGNAKLEDASSIVLAKDMGLLLKHFDNCLTQQQAEKLLTFYQQLAKRGLDNKSVSVYSGDASQDVKGREFCANNFPVVLSFAMNICPGMLNQLYEVFKALTSDSCFMVRQSIGSIFHDVANILGAKNSMMKAEFVRLLRDDAEEVLYNLVPHVQKVLLLFINQNTLNIERQDAVSNEVSKALLRCLTQVTKGYNWRLISSLLKQFEVLPLVFKSDHINSEFTPPVIRCAVHGKSKPVRSQATRTLLVFLRWNTKLMQRTWLRDHLIHELGENNSCYTRHIFVELCKHAVDLFSNKYFKENFLTPLLRLTTDKVPTIRWSTVNLFPKLKRMIRLPQDRKLLTSFEQVVIQLEKNEKDRDVLAHLLTKTKEMMSPAHSTITDEMEAREKQLVEEEENVNRGKITYIITTHSGRSKGHSGEKKGAPAAKTRAQSVNRAETKSTASSSSGGSGGASARSASAPRSQSSGSHGPSGGGAKKDNIVSDLKFYKNFYVDAGIHLPFKEDNITTVIKKASNPQLNTTPITNKTELPTEFISNNLSKLSLQNITDDVKVNMRRKKVDKTIAKRFSHSGLPTATVISSNSKNKRHSTSYSDNEMLMQSINKRRSFNMQQKDTSKIPVILKSVENVQNKTKNDCKDIKTSISNLPVPIKKSVIHH